MAGRLGESDIQTGEAGRVRWRGCAQLLHRGGGGADLFEVGMGRVRFVGRDYVAGCPGRGGQSQGGPPAGLATQLEALQAEGVADDADELPGPTGRIRRPGLPGTLARHGQRGHG